MIAFIIQDCTLNLSPSFFHSQRQTSGLSLKQNEPTQNLLLVEAENVEIPKLFSCFGLLRSFAIVPMKQNLFSRNFFKFQGWNWIPSAKAPLRAELSVVGHLFSPVTFIRNGLASISILSFHEMSYNHLLAQKHQSQTIIIPKRDTSELLANRQVRKSTGSLWITPQWSSSLKRPLH